MSAKWSVLVQMNCDVPSLMAVKGVPSSSLLVISLSATTVPVILKHHSVRMSVLFSIFQIQNAKNCGRGHFEKMICCLSETLSMINERDQDKDHVTRAAYRDLGD